MTTTAAADTQFPPGFKACFVSLHRRYHAEGLSHTLITSKSVCLGLQPVWVKTKINCKLAKEAHKHASFSHFCWGMCGGSGPAHLPILSLLSKLLMEKAGCGVLGAGLHVLSRWEGVPAPVSSLQPRCRLLPSQPREPGAWPGGGHMAAPQLPPPGGCGTSKSPGS